MSNILKFLKKERLIVAFLSLFLIIFTLRMITELNPIEILDSMTGGIPIYHIYIKMAFFLFVYLVQYFNADLISYMTKNVDYLSVRYGNRRCVFVEFVKREMCINGLFLLIVLVVLGCNILFTEITIHTTWYEIVVIFLKIYGKCHLFTLISFVLLTYMNEERTFGIISAIVLVNIFLKQLFDLSFLGMGKVFYLLVVFVINIVIFFVGTMVLRKIWREMVRYADSN